MTYLWCFLLTLLDILHYLEWHFQKKCTWKFSLILGLSFFIKVTFRWTAKYFLNLKILHDSFIVLFAYNSSYLDWHFQKKCAWKFSLILGLSFFFKVPFSSTAKYFMRIKRVKAIFIMILLATLAILHCPEQFSAKNGPSKFPKRWGIILTKGRLDSTKYCFFGYSPRHFALSGVNFGEKCHSEFSLILGLSFFENGTFWPTGHFFGAKIFQCAILVVIVNYIYLYLPFIYGQLKSGMHRHGIECFFFVFV